MRPSGGSGPSSCAGVNLTRIESGRIDLPSQRRSSTVGLAVTGGPVRAVIGGMKITAGFRAEDDFAVPANGTAKNLPERKLVCRKRQRKIICRHAGVDIESGETVAVIRAAIGVRIKAGAGPHRAVGRVVKISRTRRVRIAFAADERRMPKLVGFVPPIKNRQRVVERTRRQINAGGGDVDG